VRIVLIPSLATRLLEWLGRRRDSVWLPFVAVFLTGPLVLVLTYFAVYLYALFVYR